MSTTTGSTTDLTELPASCSTDAAIYNKRILFVLDSSISKVKLVDKITSVIRGENGPLVEAMPESMKRIVHRLQKRYENHITDVKQPEMEEEDNEVEVSFDTWTIAKSRCEDEDLIRLLQHLEDSFVDEPENNATESGTNINKSLHVDLFITCLQELRMSVELNQREDPVKEKAREKHLKRCQQRSDQAKREIAALEEELVTKKSALHASIIGKNLLINRHQGRIDKIQKASREAIEGRIAESEAIITADSNANETVLQSLDTDLTDGRQKYDSILKEHLAVEKQLRVQRTKVENQLVACMQKFDQDMSEKQAEEEELQAEFEEEKRKYEDIQKKLDEQEEEYDELMQEKAAYEQELLEQKLFIFILNRSARRIQRAFRAYKLRKMAKKKSKKGKKGKTKKK